MVDESIINSVRKYLRAVQSMGIPVEQGVIFGSQTSGHANDWSDIDLLIVSSYFDGRYTRTDVDLLWRIAARTDNRIEPIPVGARQFEQDDTSPIIEIARREGQVVTVEELNP